jgi:4-diphosphocytidyl-2-C-methyl-D-erythritol kinase
MRVGVFAPAKINLTLRVAPPRADGRHPLESVVVFADAGDVLTLEAGPSALTISGPFALALEGENLISRALAMLGVEARVHLEKNLPVASGIGGGSTDAAAALRGANMLFALGLSDHELEERAAVLGADVPVCVRARPVFMEGIGERLTPIDCPEVHAVLVNPGTAISTADVFKRFDQMALGSVLSAQAPHWRDQRDLLAGLRASGNDLEAPARALGPIATVIERLAAGEGVRFARMSGSGATCFAVVDAPQHAQSLAHLVQDAQPTWWVKPVRLGAIDASAYRV